MTFFLVYAIVALFTFGLAVHTAKATGLFEEEDNWRYEGRTLLSCALLWPLFWGYILYLYIKRTS